MTIERQDILSVVLSASAYAIRVDSNGDRPSVVKGWNPKLVFHILGSNFPQGNVVNEHLSQHFRILK
jgi:hypothetical protein